MQRLEAGDERLGGDDRTRAAGGNRRRGRLEKATDLGGRRRRVQRGGDNAGDRGADQRGQELFGVADDEGDDIAALQAGREQSAGHAMSGLANLRVRPESASRLRR